MSVPGFPANRIPSGVSAAVKVAYLLLTIGSICIALTALSILKSLHDSPAHIVWSGTVPMLDWLSGLVGAEASVRALASGCVFVLVTSVAMVVLNGADLYRERWSYRRMTGWGVFVCLLGGGGVSSLGDSLRYVQYGVSLWAVGLLALVLLRSKRLDARQRVEQLAADLPRRRTRLVIAAGVGVLLAGVSIGAAWRISDIATLDAVAREAQGFFDAQRYEAAGRSWRRLVQLSQRSRLPEYEAAALNRLALAARYLGRFKEARTDDEQALSIYRRLGNRAGEADALGGLGWTARGASRYEEATTYCEQALAIYRKLGEEAGEADALTCLGGAKASLRRYKEARAYLERALTIYRGLGDELGEAHVLIDLARVERKLARHKEGAAYAEQALEVYRGLRMMHGEADALLSLGLAMAASGRYQEAQRHLERALTIYSGLGDRVGEADARADLAWVAKRLLQDKPSR